MASQGHLRWLNRGYTDRGPKDDRISTQMISQTDLNRSLSQSFLLLLPINHYNNGLPSVGEQ